MRTRVTAAAIGLVVAANLAVVAARAGDDPTLAVGRRAAAPSPSANPSDSRPASPLPSLSTTPQPPRKPTSRIVLSAVEDSGAARVWSVTAAGHDLRPEPHHPAEPAKAISYATGKVVYSKVTRPAEQVCDSAGCTWRRPDAHLVIGDIGRTATTPLTQGEYDSSPSFSPNGDAIAYRSDARRKRTGQLAEVIAIVTPEGQHVRTFEPPDLASYASPTWSPDGRHIAVVRRSADHGRFRTEVVLLAVQTGRPRVIAEGEFSKLAWAPNGGFIAAGRAVRLEHRRPEERRASQLLVGFDLWVIPVSGAAPRRLTTYTPSTPPPRHTPFCGLTPEVIGVDDPVVSADSRTIAFATNHPHRHRAGRSWDVQVVNTDGTGLRTVWRAPAPTCVSKSDLRSAVTGTPLAWVGG